MKRSKLAVIMSVLLAVSMFGAACSKEETTKKKSKKSKTEDVDDDDDDDDDDETKKTKKTKKTSEETSEEPTEEPTTEATTKATTTAKETTTKQTTSNQTTSGATSGTRAAHDPLNQNPPTNSYKKISADDFKSIAESMGWFVMEDEPEDLDDEESQCVYAYDEDMEIVLIYTVYKSVDLATEEFESYKELVDESNQYGELLDSVVADNMIAVLTEDEYCVIIYIDDLEIYAYTDNSSANIQEANQALKTLGYPVE